MKLLNVFLILFFLAFSHCSNNKYYSSPEEVVQKNIEFMNAEDLEGTMSTIYPGSDSYETTENLVKQLFKVYDLNYKLVKLEVLNENDQEATLKFIQLTTKINGPKFRDNRIKGTHIIRKDGDSWRIFATKIDDTEYLN